MQVGKAGRNKHKQRLRGKEHGYRRPGPSSSTYTAAFSDAWNAAFRSTVCMHVCMGYLALRRKASHVGIH